MIPNLTIIIAAYVGLRCFEIIAGEIRRSEKSGWGLSLMVLSMFTAAVTSFCTWETLNSGADVTRQLGNFGR